MSDEANQLWYAAASAQRKAMADVYKARAEALKATGRPRDRHAAATLIILAAEISGMPLVIRPERG